MRMRNAFHSRDMPRCVREAEARLNEGTKTVMCEVANREGHNGPRREITTADQG